MISIIKVFSDSFISKAHCANSLQYVIDSKEKNILGRRIYRKVMIRHNKTQDHIQSCFLSRNVAEIVDDIFHSIY